MTLQLSPLQQHCLAGIGITTWQQQNITPHSEINEPVADYALVKDNITVFNRQSDVKQCLVAQIETALEYASNHGDMTFTWCVDEDSTSSSLIDNQLTLPNLPLLLADSSLKKELWTLLSGNNS